VLPVVVGLILLMHAFVHMRVWIWGMPGAGAHDAHRSWLLPNARAASRILAVLAAAMLAAAGAGALAGQSWWPLAALAACLVSTALIALVFNRWLTLGLAVNAVVAALAIVALGS
jgi:hypothetical protein